MIPLSNLPDYVERGGAQVWRPPGSSTDVELYGFVLAADSKAIDALLIRDLVIPSLGSVDYRAVHDNVLVTFGAIGHEASLDPVDSTRGYVREFEVSIWCLVADMNSPGRLLWYLPYIFTDSEQTVATGREIFGYPKQLGHFDAGYPANLRAGGGTTTLSALAIDPFAPTTEARELEMMRVERAPGAGTLPKQPTLVDEISLLFPGGFSVDPSIPYGSGQPPAAAITPSGATPPPSSPPLPPWITGMLNAIQGKSLTGNPTDLITDMVNNTTLVFLKQFRDVSCPTKACYQAVVEAPINIHPLGSSYDVLDPSLFALTIQSYASDPIAADLGIPAGKPVVPQRAFQATLGFDIALGLEVWRSPT